MRGELSKKVQREAEARMGRKIVVTELRLMPYIQFVMVNDQRLDPNKITSGEREILAVWRKEKRIEGGAGGLSITREFWDTINALIWIAYVLAEGDG